MFDAKSNVIITFQLINLFVSEMYSEHTEHTCTRKRSFSLIATTINDNFCDNFNIDFFLMKNQINFIILYYYIHLY